MTKNSLLLILLLIAACQSKPVDTIRISINHQQNSLKVTGVSATSLYGLRHDTLSLQAWQNLFPVYQMPADTDLRNYQPAISGKYALSGNIIVFKPDTPFVAGQTYFARYYHYDEHLSSIDMALNRRKPGETPYTELIFKY
jgi:hypothetical protein